MANTLTSLILLILLCKLVIAARTNMFSFRGQDGIAALAPAPIDGICKTMVEKQGYACEEHTVTTQDGFILSLQRIPVGVVRWDSRRQATSSATSWDTNGWLDGATWLFLPPDQSLAFVLADNGFDVWLANSRATKSSSGHTSLSPSDAAYWDWSWDELVAYDLPAMFQYVHDQAGQNLHYIGYSQGTLIALAAFSKNQLLGMLRSVALLCPVAYVGKMATPLARLAADNFIAKESYWLGLNEFNPTGVAAIKLISDICSKPDIDCTNLLTSFTGPNCCLNTSLMGVILNHGPQSTATKNMIHLAQMIKEGTIAMYDYDNKDENNRHYGQPTPPVYNITSIPNDLPLFLSYGGADAIADAKDVQLLLDSLKDHLGDKLVVNYQGNYAHVDFIMGVNVKQVVYDPLMDFLKLQ